MDAEKLQGFTMHGQCTGLVNKKYFLRVYKTAEIERDPSNLTPSQD